MTTINANTLFDEIGGKYNGGYPVIDVPVFHTSTCQNTPYLKAPGVACIVKPSMKLQSIKGFLSGFDESLGFDDYLNDSWRLPDGTLLDESAVHCMFAGQLCYFSFGPKRTKKSDAMKYFDNIRVQRHGSVIEHANFSFLFYGISRSLTHELVRHRLFSFSQVSQRYVSKWTLRFVERPEWSNDENLHAWFERRIDHAAMEYEDLTDILLCEQEKGAILLSSERRTDLKKKVRQAARSCLTNETEAPIVVTGNARTWRHFLEMRASEHAEVEIRELATRVFLCLHQLDPVLFGDYTLDILKDGTYAVSTEYRKV